MPRVLILMTHNTYRAAPFVGAAARCGLSLTVATDRRQVFEKDNPQDNVTVDFSSVERAAKAVAEFCATVPCQAVLAADDEGVVIAAEAARRLGLPGNAPDAARAARNKLLTRQALVRAELNAPWFELLSTADDAGRVARRLPYPCVVKPLTLSASRGVMRADDAAGFVRAFDRLAAYLALPETAAEAGDAAGSMLVEGFLPGVEVALEGLVTGGLLRPLVLFDKPEPMQGPLFEETVFVTPSLLAADVQRRVAGEAAAAVSALGLTHGPVHVELRVDDAGVPTVLEIAPRSIGGQCSQSLRFGDGVSLEELILRHALGEDVSAFEREDAASGVMMLPIPGRGVLEAVRGETGARAVRGITGLSITIPLGHEVVPLPEGSRYLGFMFARARRPEDVRRALRQAYARLTFEIAPVERQRADGARVPPTGPRDVPRGGQL